eukprot:scaffold52959_cov59-Phaeocystis_antarctica.AAC.2
MYWIKGSLVSSPKSSALRSPGVVEGDSPGLPAHARRRQCGTAVGLRAHERCICKPRLTVRAPAAHVYMRAPIMFAGSATFQRRTCASFAVALPVSVPRSGRPPKRKPKKRSTLPTNGLDWLAATSMPLRKMRRSPCRFVRSDALGCAWPFSNCSAKCVHTLTSIGVGSMGPSP